MTNPYIPPSEEGGTPPRKMNSLLGALLGATFFGSMTLPLMSPANWPDFVVYKSLAMDAALLGAVCFGAFTGRDKGEIKGTSYFSMAGNITTITNLWAFACSTTCVSQLAWWRN